MSCSHHGLFTETSLRSITPELARTRSRVLMMIVFRTTPQVLAGVFAISQVYGHGSGQEVLHTCKGAVNIDRVELVGSNAL